MRSSTANLLNYQGEFLSRDDEIRLSLRIRAAIDLGKIDYEAEAIFARSFLALVVKVAKSFISKGDFDDLVGIGVQGLIKAMRRYDPHNGCRFPGYAIPTIRQTIRRYLDQEGYHTPMRIPIHICEAIRGKPRQGLKSLADTKPIPRSFSADRLGGLPGHIFHSDLSEDREFLLAALDHITEPKRRIVRLKFGLDPCDDPTIPGIAAMIGIGRETVRKLFFSGMQQMREYARSTGCL